MHVYDLFLESINIKKQLFTQTEINQFKNDRLLLDDYITKNDCEFISKYTHALKERISFSKQYLSTIKDIPLDYSGTDTLYFDATKHFDHFENNAKAEKFWRKKIRYNVLRTIIEDSTDIYFIKTNFNILEDGVKQKVIDHEICVLDEILRQGGGIAQFVEAAFFNALLGYHDPHSLFFDTSEKDLFNHQLANNQMSFGITTVKNDDGVIVISSVAPGSPAFKNADIETNDVLKSISTTNGILETYCISNNDILKVLNDENLKKATFKIQKRNGEIKYIKLRKGRVENEENSITGYILEHKDGTSTKVGYINIASFYTDLERNNGLGMANDVAKEIYKLKKDNIGGLIIDLRFDGGGSLKEAIDLSGLFIDRGPITIMRYRNDETYTLKDVKRGAVYTKPLIVLVNQFSASASELFASVMQDYNRAVIIGSKTHGKSSAQVVMPIGSNPEYGFVKLTTERFYRPTGKTHQSLGVTPDIELPSLYDNFKSQEHFQPYALPNDTIAVSMQLKPQSALNVNTLRDKSNVRLGNSTAFKDLRNLNKELVKDYINKKITYPLALEYVYDDMNQMKRLWTATKDVMLNSNTKIKAKNNTALEKVLRYDDVKHEKNKTDLQDLSQDIVLEEAYFIINDFIKLN